MPPYRNRVWPIIFAAMAALLAVFASRAFRAAHYQGRKAIDKKAFHVVSLQLPGAPERVKGLVVSRAPYGLGRGDLMEPQQITIRTDDGWSMTLLGRSSTISM